MTHLRKMMLEELERRNYAQTTIHSYLSAVAEFSLHFHRPPNQLGPDHIRQYQAYLFGQQKLAPSTVTQRLAALRFFYIKTLRKPWSVTETPYPKKVQRLPIILGSEEVAQLIDSALTPFHHIVLMTLYATGVRRAELTRLKITDIDSRRMIGGTQNCSYSVAVEKAGIFAIPTWIHFKPQIQVYCTNVFTLCVRIVIVGFHCRLLENSTASAHQ